MKLILSISLLLISFCLFAQSITISEWENNAKSDKRLLPKYGNQPKTHSEKEADAELIKTILNEGLTRKEGSELAIEEGSRSLVMGDLYTAMLRFNQAYVLDSTNTNIYWGYGLVYYSLGLYNQADYQLREGLGRNESNEKLYAVMSIIFNEKFEKYQSEVFLDSAYQYASRSYELEPNQPDILNVLIKYYINSNNCDMALNIYNEASAIKGNSVPNRLKRELRKSCGSLK